VSPVKYELGFYIPEDDILHSHRRENLKSYILEATSTTSVITKLAPVVTPLPLVTGKFADINQYVHNAIHTYRTIIHVLRASNCNT
jgi:hypothetical protein